MSYFFGKPAEVILTENKARKDMEFNEYYSGLVDEMYQADIKDIEELYNSHSFKPQPIVVRF